jgi:hypothetical protein
MNMGAPSMIGNAPMPNMMMRNAPPPMPNMAGPANINAFGGMGGMPVPTNTNPMGGRPFGRPM